PVLEELDRHQFARASAQPIGYNHQTRRPAERRRDLRQQSTYIDGREFAHSWSNIVSVQSGAGNREIHLNTFRTEEFPPGSQVHNANEVRRFTFL
ncbi:hypothetical protein, partial [Acidiphilium sp.]|uniref:hypothetical protein n=1 Tax=Acidiphilium sp. TaxID=527 RepID=UPI003D02855A